MSICSSKILKFASRHGKLEASFNKLPSNPTPFLRMTIVSNTAVWTPPPPPPPQKRKKTHTHTPDFLLSFCYFENNFFFLVVVMSYCEFCWKFKNYFCKGDLFWKCLKEKLILKYNLSKTEIKNKFRQWPKILLFSSKRSTFFV